MARCDWVTKGFLKLLKERNKADKKMKLVNTTETKRLKIETKKLRKTLKSNWATRMLRAAGPDTSKSANV